MLVVIAVLLWRSQSHGGGAEASISLGEIFTAAVKLEPQDASSADAAVRRAARERGEPEPRTQTVMTASTTKLARILWVDDYPDGNLYETVALEQLGKFVTKATSTAAALRYLDELDFALIITDVGRDGDHQAGKDLIRRVRSGGHTLPIVVYTVGAARRRAALLEAGADAVVHMPDELVHDVTSRLAAR
ncbi:response regulator [Actinomadura barringtoniae]|uniref:Response regulator n=1 Tax=Actinomadura barringtoniae TaxID=1427535 RepID=A0A939PDR4_9ACTN|nr:response regulator [Actinomadura barringtoniae]MBO2450746.1 response regulator [Actinomadura barringtoniae]